MQTAYYHEACLTLVIVFYDASSLDIGCEQACSACSKHSHSTCEDSLHTIKVLESVQRSLCKWSEDLCKQAFDLDGAKEALQR